MHGRCRIGRHLARTAGRRAALNSDVLVGVLQRARDSWDGEGERVGITQPFDIALLNAAGNGRVAIVQEHAWRERKVD